MSDGKSKTDFTDFGQYLARNTHTFGDKTALVIEEERVSWRAFGSDIARTANGIIEADIAPKDCVVTIGHVTREYLTAYFSVMAAGACLVPLSTLFPEDTLARIIEDCEPKMVFVDAANLHLVEAAARTVGALLVSLNGPQCDRSLADLMSANDTYPEIDHAPDMPMTLFYTSGTTGHPKGVTYSRAARLGDLAPARGVGMSADAITMVATPPYSNTTFIMLFPTAAFGGCLVYMPKFDAEDFLKISEREHASFTILVPVQYERILKVDDFERFDLNHYQLKMCTSAPLRASVKKDVVDRWPGKFIELFGMSEGGVATLLDCNAHPDKLHTVGKVLIGEVKFFDDDDQEVAPGEIGEIVGRSHSMMDGYYNQTEKTHETSWYDQKGQRWQRTGDLGRMDEDGFIEILGRKKDMIISGGHNIYPTDLEEVIAEHPAVLEVAVVGIESDTWGETPYAFLVKHPGADDEDVVSWANQRLGKIQRLSGAQWIDAIPRNGLGKPMKNELRDMVSGQKK